MIGIDISKLVTYFTAVATNNKQILHVAGDDTNKRFFHLDIEEILNGEKHTFQGYALILENMDGGFFDALSDNIREQASCAFSIVKKHEIRNNGHAELVTILSTSYAIAKQVITKMRKDRMNRELSGLDMQSFQYHKVGPVMGGAYGYRVTFQFNQPAFLAFVPAQWNNEDPLTL